MVTSRGRGVFIPCNLSKDTLVSYDSVGGNGNHRLFLFKMLCEINHQEL